MTAYLLPSQNLFKRSRICLSCLLLEMSSGNATATFCSGVGLTGGLTEARNNLNASYRKRKLLGRSSGYSKIVKNIQIIFKIKLNHLPKI